MEVKLSQWCLNKAKEALKDYDQPSALDYIKMAELWLGRDM